MVPGFMRLLTLMSPDREMKKQMEELGTQGLKYVSTNMNCTMDSEFKNLDYDTRSIFRPASVGRSISVGGLPSIRSRRGFLWDTAEGEVKVSIDGCTLRFPCETECGIFGANISIFNSIPYFFSPGCSRYRTNRGPTRWHKITPFTYNHTITHPYVLRTWNWKIVKLKS